MKLRVHDEKYKFHNLKKFKIQQNNMGSQEKVSKISGTKATTRYESKKKLRASLSSGGYDAINLYN